MRANNSVIALMTSGLIASCFYGNATLIPSNGSGGAGGNPTQGGQAGHGAADGGILSTAGTANTRAAGAAGKTNTTGAGRAGSAGASGGQDHAGTGNLAGGGAGGRNTTAVGSAGNAGYGVTEPPSCRGLESWCNGESCCTSLTVPAGSINRGSTPGAKECAKPDTCEDSEYPEKTVKISSFALDKYEVTVGRFRNFLKDYDSIMPPSPGDGTNTSVSPRGPKTGWDSTWSSKLLTQSALRQSLANACDTSTWVGADGNNDRYPINCIDWYTAFAFCIWDGGRLPTEAEWEYVAAGGTQNRVYPWGDSDPTTALASFVPGTPRMDVGSKPAGKGFWEHLDLAGSVFEWTLDNYDAGWYVSAESQVDNPAHLESSADLRSARGGSALDGTTSLRAAARHPTATAGLRINNLGVRCARNVVTK